MWLEDPSKTLTVATMALVVGAMIITVALTTLNWVFS